MVHLLDAAHAFEGECDLTGGWNGGPASPVRAALGNYRVLNSWQMASAAETSSRASRPQQRDQLARGTPLQSLR